jgi:hypothetical protein
LSGPRLRRAGLKQEIFARRFHRDKIDKRHDQDECTMLAEIYGAVGAGLDCDDLSSPPRFHMDNLSGIPPDGVGTAWNGQSNLRIRPNHDIPLLLFSKSLLPLYTGFCLLGEVLLTEEASRFYTTLCEVSEG